MLLSDKYGITRKLGNVARRIEHNSMMIAARDILVSVMLPWHTCNQHRILICKIRDEIDANVSNVAYTPDSSHVHDLFERCRDVAAHIAFDSGTQRCYDRMMRAKTMFDALIVYIDVDDTFDVNKLPK